MKLKKEYSTVCLLFTIHCCPLSLSLYWDECSLLNFSVLHFQNKPGWHFIIIIIIMTILWQGCIISVTQQAIELMFVIFLQYLSLKPTFVVILYKWKRRLRPCQYIYIYNSQRLINHSKCILLSPGSWLIKLYLGGAMASFRVDVSSSLC